MTAKKQEQPSKIAWASQENSKEVNDTKIDWFSNKNPNKEGDQSKIPWLASTQSPLGLEFNKQSDEEETPPRTLENQNHTESRSRLKAKKIAQNNDDFQKYQDTMVGVQDRLGALNQLESRSNERPQQASFEVTPEHEDNEIEE